MSLEFPSFHTPGLSPEERILERERLEKIEEASLRKMAQASMAASPESADIHLLREQLGQQARAAAYELITTVDPDFEKATVLQLEDGGVASWYLTYHPASLRNLYLTRFGELAGATASDFEITRLKLEAFDASDLTHLQKDIKSELSILRIQKGL